MTDLLTAVSHPFYWQLNELLHNEGLDEFVMRNAPAFTLRRWDGCTVFGGSKRALEPCSD